MPLPPVCAIAAWMRRCLSMRVFNALWLSSPPVPGSSGHVQDGCMSGILKLGHNAIFFS